MQNIRRNRRTVLVAPGSDDRKARKALASRVDEVVLDLEDSVTPSNKDAARQRIHELIGASDVDRYISVRINSLTTGWARDDLAMCATLPNLTSVVVPKSESAADIRVVEKALSGTNVGIQALIETPVGVRDIDHIVCADERLEAVILGYADLGALLGRLRTATPQHWSAVQDRVLIAARAAGVAAIDGPFLGIADDEEFRLWCTWTSTLGFDGKWVIHPAQVDTAASMFVPSNAAVADARRVLDALAESEAHGDGATQLDGQMLDEAVAVAARRVLAKASIR